MDARREASEVNSVYPGKGVATLGIPAYVNQAFNAGLRTFFRHILS
ncbi:hypothetical protein PATSB16_41550 [Pandoraea thiooxydans]|nr:hypothetical protein PATSB16_41550 [Pandoraea thiooxydans]